MSRVAPGWQDIVANTNSPNYRPTPCQIVKAIVVYSNNKKQSRDVRPNQATMDFRWYGRTTVSSGHQ
jgi:hypothetical protein